MGILSRQLHTRYGTCRRRRMFWQPSPCQAVDQCNKAAGNGTDHSLQRPIPAGDVPPSRLAKRWRSRMATRLQFIRLHAGSAVRLRGIDSGLTTPGRNFVTGGYVRRDLRRDQYYRSRRDLQPLPATHHQPNAAGAATSLLPLRRPIPAVQCVYY